MISMPIVFTGMYAAYQYSAEYTGTQVWQEKNFYQKYLNLVSCNIHRLIKTSEKRSREILPAAPEYAFIIMLCKQLRHL